MAEAEPETSAVVAPLQVFLSSTPPQQQQTRTRKTIVFFVLSFFPSRLGDCAYTTFSNSLSGDNVIDLNEVANRSSSSNRWTLT